MYWYIKYPLCAILICALLGLSCWVFRSCRRNGDGNVEIQQPGQGVEVDVPVTKSDDGVGSAGGAKGAAAANAGQRPTAADNGETTTRIVKTPSDGDMDSKLAMANAQLEKGMLEAARALAWKVIDSDSVSEFSPTWEQAVAVINEADRRIMNSTAPASEKRGYRVVKGDSLNKIASRFYTNQLALKRINENLRRDGGEPIIRPTQTIMYISGTWSIRVSKQHFRLLLYLDGKLYRSWVIGIGKDNRTPVGKFLITGALYEPAWTPPGRSIPFGDPENVLGTRWLKLTPTDGTDTTLEGYGIHGTWEPDTVGTSCSAGCVRMRNEEVEELYDFIPPPGGSAPPVRVTIEE